jgi:hypothetical protein
LADPLLSCREDRVRVAPLRHSATLLGPVGDHVTLDDLDVVDVIAQHPSGDQPGHAGPDDDCCRHPTLPDRIDRRDTRRPGHRIDHRRRGCGTLGVPMVVGC